MLRRNFIKLFSFPIFGCLIKKPTEKVTYGGEVISLNTCTLVYSFPLKEKVTLGQTVYIDKGGKITCKKTKCPIGFIVSVKEGMVDVRI